MRKFLFLALSAGVHLLVLGAIAYFATTDEKIYENIEITSYVSAAPKLATMASQSPKLEKPKAEAVDVTKSDVSELSEKSTENSEVNSASGQPASDSEITSPARLLSQIKANRTEAARKADYSGISQIELVIGSDGVVKQAKLRNSLPHGLDAVALDIALKAKFKPAMIDNQPVASAILFKVRFESEK